MMNHKDGWTYLFSRVTTYARASQLPLKLREMFFDRVASFILCLGVKAVFLI